MAKVSKTKWAYAAAMLDGEGHISITSHLAKYGKGKTYLLYDLKIGVSNTSLTLMEWMKESFKGDYRDGGQGMRKACYRWDLDGYKAMEKFLLGVLPYMVIKREQAKTAIEFCRMLNVKNPQKRKELCERCKALNAGITPTTNTPGASLEAKIESDLTGDRESALAVMHFA